MATGTAPPPQPPPPPPRPGREQPKTGNDGFIEARIRKTQGYVKLVDLAGGLMTLLAGTLAYLLVFALVDHWLFSGGLGFAGRLTALCVLLIGLAGYAAWQLLPVLVGHVNPVYAADAIEQAQPSLKNSLVNFLLLRSNPTGVAACLDWDADSEEFNGSRRQERLSSPARTGLQPSSRVACNSTQPP